MKSYDVAKLAARKVIDDGYCILNIKINAGKGVSEVGVTDNNDRVVFDMKFKTGAENEPATFVDFKDNIESILSTLTSYKHVIVFNETLVKKLLTDAMFVAGVNTRTADKVFKKAFDMRLLYDSYTGIVNTRLDIACEAEGIDTKNVKDAVAICGLVEDLLRSIAGDYTYPNKDKYTTLALTTMKTKTERSTKQEKRKSQKKEATPKKELYIAAFNNGAAIAEIAKKYSVKDETVLNTVIDAFYHGKVNSVDSLIKNEYHDKIVELYKDDQWDGTLKSIHELMPDDCTYADIKASIAKQKKADGFIPDEEGTPLSESYAKLYNLGKSLTEIAREKGVQIYTASSNVIKAYEEGLIENIDGMIQKEYIQDILEKIKEADWDGKLKSIKEKLDEKCSYETIKAVIAKNKKGCYNEEESSADVPNSSNNTPQEPSDSEAPKE